MKSVIIKIVFAFYTLSPIPVLIYFSSVPMVFSVHLPEKESRSGTMNTRYQATGEQLLTGQQRGLVIEPPQPPELSIAQNNSYGIKTQAGQWRPSGKEKSDRAR